MSRMEALGREYVAALEAYVEARDEPALSRGYELGRRALADGLGVLDMAVLHRAALAEAVTLSARADRERFARSAADFFHELLSPFEMSFRGYRSANDELQHLNEILRQQKEAAENANRELESFSYSVSHDLRAPLRSIDGFSQILLEDYAEALDEGGKKYLRYVVESAQRMGQLIDDLLGLARVSRADISRVEVDMTSLVSGICDRLRASCPERVCAFAIQSGVRGTGDARLLAVLLENLLGNAWKFTSKRTKAEIAFGSEERGGTTAYFVRDNGAGFDMTYANRLFGAFQRLHSATEFEGTGIGLATVQRVVNRHDGRVWAEGKLDSGASFYFTLGGGRNR